MSKAVVPISGGLDSSVILSLAASVHEEVYALTYNYGQKHNKEILYAGLQIDEYENIEEHKIIDISFFKDIAPTSSLTNDNIKVAHARDVLGDAQTVNYVPFRNQMLLSICSAIAESLEANTVFHGAAQVDTQAGYWDGSNEFLEAINSLTSLNRKHRIKIEAPLIELSKKEIIQWGVELDVSFRNTWTCYKGEDKACGECTACSSRLQGFIDAGYRDPLDYSKEIPWDKLLNIQIK